MFPYHTMPTSCFFSVETVTEQDTLGGLPNSSVCLLLEAGKLLTGTRHPSALVLPLTRLLMVNFELYPHTVERKEMIEMVSFFSGQGLIRLFPCPHSSFILHYLLATRSSDTGLSRVKICYVVFEVLYLSSQHMEIHKHGA